MKRTSKSMKPISKTAQFFFLLLFLHCHSESDHTALIYHHCTNSQTPTSTSTSEALSSLFKSLITHSTNSTFHTQTTAQNGIPISGEYQCRGDMSSTACQTCVTQLGILSNRLCAGARNARVQLRGCYMRYETDGEVEEEVKNWELVHKECGEIKGYAYDEGTGARNGALWAVEEGIVRSGNGFWEARNEGVRAVAQCERALFGCDCAECVGRAAEVAQEDCSDALSADVYLNGCYLSYATYAYPSGYKNNGSSGRVAAIVLGGFASIGLALILLMFFKSCGKKDDY
ncbi:Cysteine-rich repeat secretory protein 3, partial [Cucurbita argyrosperma subsp. argyrosperma]